MLGGTKVRAGHRKCATMLLFGQCGCIIFGGKIWVLPFKVSGAMIYTYQIYCQFTTFLKMYMFIGQLSFSPWTEIQLNPYSFLSKQLKKLLVQVTIPNSSHEERTVPETPSNAASTNCDRPASFSLNVYNKPRHSTLSLLLVEAVMERMSVSSSNSYIEIPALTRRGGIRRWDLWEMLRS